MHVNLHWRCGNRCRARQPASLVGRLESTWKGGKRVEPPDLEMRLLLQMLQTHILGVALPRDGMQSKMYLFILQNVFVCIENVIVLIENVFVQ